MKIKSIWKIFTFNINKSILYNTQSTNTTNILQKRLHKTKPDNFQFDKNRNSNPKNRKIRNNTCVGLARHSPIVRDVTNFRRHFPSWRHRISSHSNSPAKSAGGHHIPVHHHQSGHPRSAWSLTPNERGHCFRTSSFFSRLILDLICQFCELIHRRVAQWFILRGNNTMNRSMFIKFPENFHWFDVKGVSKCVCCN